MKNSILAISILLVLTCCNNSNTTDSKSTTAKDSVAKAPQPAAKPPKHNKEDYIVQKKDDMTGKTTISMKDPVVIDGKESLDITAYKTDGDIILALTTNVPGCTDKNQEVNFLFTDSSRKTLYNLAYNCHHNSIITLSKGYMEGLDQKKIKKVRVWNMSGFIEKELSDYDADNIMNTLKYLAE